MQIYTGDDLSHQIKVSVCKPCSVTVVHIRLYICSPVLSVSTAAFLYLLVIHLKVLCCNIEISPLWNEKGNIFNVIRDKHHQLTLFSGINTQHKTQEKGRTDSIISHKTHFRKSFFPFVVRMMAPNTKHGLQVQEFTHMCNVC